MNPVFWLLMGGSLGWLAGLRIERSTPRAIMESLLAGVFGALSGALVGGALSTPSVEFAGIGQQGFSLLSLGHSFLGAALLLTVLRVLRAPAPIR